MTGKTSTERARKSMKSANDYPESDFGSYPGYWTELIQLYDWPPNWEPQSEWGHSTVEVSKAATRGKEEKERRKLDQSLVGIRKSR